MNKAKNYTMNCLFMYYHCGSSYQEGRVVTQLTGLTLLHVCACPKPEDLDFKCHMSSSFLYSASSIKMRGDC